MPLNEYEFPENKLANITSQYEKLVERNFFLNQSARAAYQSFMQAYASHTFKEIFDVHKLDLKKVAKGFGLPIPPRVNILTMPLKKGKKTKNRRMMGKRLRDS